MKSQNNRAKENNSSKTKKNFAGLYTEDDPNLLNLGMDSCMKEIHANICPTFIGYTGKLVHNSDD